MQQPERQRTSARGGFVILVAATLIVSFLQHAFYDMATPTLDALRYADYAVNIHDHRVFGLSGTRRDVAPQPGNANSPLYPAFVAALMHVDPKLADSLRCVLAQPDAAATCPTDYGVLVAAQCALVIGALACLWFAAMGLFARPALAGLACVLAFASTKPMFYANRVLTENLVLFLFAALMAAIVAAGRGGHVRAWAAIGLILGALTLTRPEYLYLGYVMGLFGLAALIAGARARRAAKLAAAVCVFAIVVGPWLARNANHFGTANVTGGYGDVILAYRAGYNHMRPAEWAGAFIAWLPGYGEALAAKLLPAPMVAKLGTGPDSYVYREGAEIFERGLTTVDGNRDRLAGYLIRTEILGKPLTHLATSIPLAWRGVLAGKYLAVAGLPCTLLLFVVAVRRRQWLVLALLLPAATMIALYAAVSASVPRYNVYLIFYYGLAVGWVLSSLIERRVILVESG